MPLLAVLRQRARRLKAETLALYLTARHPGTPWYAKLSMHESLAMHSRADAWTKYGRVFTANTLSNVERR